MEEEGIAEMIIARLTIYSFKPIIFQTKIWYDETFIPGGVSATLLTLAECFSAVYAKKM